MALSKLTGSHVQTWELDIKEGRVLKSWCFRTVVLEKALESPLDSKDSNQSILKDISPEYSLEGHNEAEAPILWPPGVKSWLIGKDPEAGKDWRQEEIEDKMVGWHHRLNAHEFEQIPRDDKGQGSTVVHWVAKRWTWLSNWIATRTLKNHLGDILK